MNPYRYIPPHRRMAVDTTIDHLREMLALKREKREISEEHQLTPHVSIAVRNNELFLHILHDNTFKRPSFAINLDIQTFIPDDEPQLGTQYVWILPQSQLRVWVHNKIADVAPIEICRIEYLKFGKKGILYKDTCVEDYEFAKIEAEFAEIKKREELERIAAEEAAKPAKKPALPNYYKWIPPGIARQLYPLFDPGTVEDRSIVHHYRYATAA